MLITFVLVAVLLSVAILFAIFSSFIPFVNTYGQIMQYTSAYYGAISALERGMLAVRYAGPGFDGESGWRYDKGNSLGHYNTGNIIDSFTGDFFSYGNSGATTLYWNVKSRTRTVPQEGNGDIDPIFIDGATSDSRNYNMLEYNTLEIVPFSVVQPVGSNDYYKKLSDDSAGNASIEGELRLNPYLFKIFATNEDLSTKNCAANSSAGCLCLSNCPSGDRDNNRVRLLPMVDWSLRGTFSGSEFVVIPFDASDAGGVYTVYSRDSLIRKDDINTYFDQKNYLDFGNTQNPLQRRGTSSSNPGTLNVISAHDSVLKNMTFTSIINDSRTEGSYLTLSLVNHLWNNAVGKKGRYPFLEYKFTSSDDIADRFYKIIGESKVGDYNVKLQIRKPTIRNGSVFGNFTIMF